MLETLSIRDFILIESLDLAFEPGLNVLTGETGAGKSILLDALSFVLGERAERTVVRSGAQQASVTAVFNAAGNSVVEALLDANGMAPEAETVLRRVVTADGRSRAFINGQPLSVTVLRSIGAKLVEIHGQHDERGLLDPSGHRALLDAYAGLETEAAAVRLAWENARTATAALEEARKRQSDRLREAEFVAHAIEELQSFDPKEGEEDLLARERSHLQAAEKIAGDLAEAMEALTGHAGSEAKMNLAVRRLARAQSATAGALAAGIAALERAHHEVAEASAAIAAAQRSFGADPRRLEAVETRLFALRALARKYAVSPDALKARLDSFEKEGRALAHAETEQAELEAAAQAAHETFIRLGLGLSDKRRRAAQLLDKSVAAELLPLKLAWADFKTTLTDLPETERGPGGLDRVAFAVSTNPGAPHGALNKIASGGELSRFILALKVALAGQGEAGTLIFDEIDRGVGGAVADAVGERLLHLSQETQILLVTHSPQVAARGQHHWHVSKAIEGGAMRTSLRKLASAERVEEVARMLSGATVTGEARAAAGALLGIVRVPHRKRTKS